MIFFGSLPRPLAISRFASGALIITAFAFLLSISETPLGAAEGLAGRYRLAPDARLITHNLDLEFFREKALEESADRTLPESKSGIWSARIIALPDSDTPDRCRQCPHPFTEQPLLNLKIIQGLRERDDGEFLYGRLVLPGQPDRLRCKVWRRGNALYLRIYEKHHYTTHRLTSLP